MKRAIAFALFALTACTPTPSEPEATVRAIYKPLVDSKGDTGADIATIPMTTELALLIQEVESAADGPVFDWDLAGNCQDCTGFSDFQLGAPKDDGGAAAVEDRKVVEARFKLSQGEPHAVLWDMVKTPEGWRVDNIRADNVDLRKTASDMIAAAEAERAVQTNTESDEAVECIAYISLEADAIMKATPPGDTAKLDAANAAWRKKAESFFTPDELAQYLASSVAVFDDTPPAELKLKADNCTAKMP